MTMLAKVSVVLVAIAAGGALAGWQLQGQAADALNEAKVFQAREVASQGEPPSAEENEKIIEVLSEAIDVRRSIEEILVQIEDDVLVLRQQQEQAGRITEQADTQLAAIGSSLAGAVDASGSSQRRLGRLEAALGRSATLARLIAQELEELDRKMGPSAGGRP